MIPFITEHNPLADLSPLITIMGDAMVEVSRQFGINIVSQIPLMSVKLIGLLFLDREFYFLDLDSFVKTVYLIA